MEKGKARRLIKWHLAQLVLENSTRGPCFTKTQSLDPAYVTPAPFHGVSRMQMQRLFRARGAVTSLAKRYISTDAPSAQPRHAPESAPHLLSDSQGTTPNLLEDRTSGTYNKDQSVTSQEASSLHPLLHKCYEAFGPLKRGRGKKNDEGTPMWGAWGIPIKFASRAQPPTTL